MIRSLSLKYDAPQLKRLAIWKSIVNIIHRKLLIKLEFANSIDCLRLVQICCKTIMYRRRKTRIDLNNMISQLPLFMIFSSSFALSLQ